VYTLYFPHEKRGKEGMDAMGALGETKGKSRNLLERLTGREDKVLRFMTMK
jgi:hypothetical protein